MKAANPPDLQKFATTLEDLTPILQGVVGIIGLVTAAQWLWNIAMDANPLGLIVLAIAAVIAIIVLIATKTTWFQDLWKATWGWVKKAASNVWDWLKALPERSAMSSARSRTSSPRHSGPRSTSSLTPGTTRSAH
jgi:hypothetical protein